MTRYIKRISIAWLIMVVLSFIWNYLDAQSQRQEDALQSARSLFQQIVLTRAWNARHGGVYVPITEQTHPNPYLIDPNRDIKVNDDLTLTKINPAFMTRQIAELAEYYNEQVSIHITSLNPLRPDNRASEIETTALRKFESGALEFSQVLKTNELQSKLFYMAPLITEKSCLQCHANQGYSEGDIRGGISVTMPFRPNSAIAPLLIWHLILGISGIAVITFGGNKLNRAYSLIKQQSDTDYLTGLANRRFFQEQLNQVINRSQRSGQRFALLLMDLDHFKEVNDSLGHNAGDKLLRQIADSFKSRFRGNDIVARLGGDEFALILEQVNSTQDAAKVANQILQIFSDNWQIDDHQKVKVGISIGVSIYPAHGQSDSSLMQQADHALYRAKESGRNCFRFYTDDLTHSALRRLQLEQNLRNAIESDQLSVHYQPIIAMADNRIIAVEALLRWNDPVQGVVLPEQFIPVAEESGLIGKLGEIVLEQALATAARWRSEGLNIDLCINISAFQIHHSDFLNQLHSALENSDLPASQLILELTEAVVMERELESLELLNSIRKLGVRLAIDGFGTGYSSMAQLRHFPVEYLKVDRRFIHELNPATPEKTVINAVLKVGHAFNFKVIVSGVETLQQQHLLQHLGCDAVQGFLFSEALPDRAFILLYSHHHPAETEL